MKRFIQLVLLFAIAFSVNADASPGAPADFSGNGSPEGENCSVVILLDSTVNAPLLIASATGTPPFTYQWDNGETTESIVILQWANNYCVTVTDANGCEASTCMLDPNSCSVTVQQTPALGLLAAAGGIPPFTFAWETGETSSSILPATSGTYCVTVTDFTGCTASGCGYFEAGGGGLDSCSVDVFLDSSNVGGLVVVAFPTGEAPFAYTWNTGATTPSVNLLPNIAEYCVTVTDADGCVASDCFYFNTGCTVEIILDDSVNVAFLFAHASGTFPLTYLWNTGETSALISPSAPGTYCVTITDNNGCSSTDCYDYDPFQGSQIQGYIYLPDSLSPLVWQGYAELFGLNATGNFELVATVFLENIQNGWGNYYDFGSVSPGQYLVKVTVDPNDPISADYLPTYYGNSILWDEATVITTPSNQTFFNITMDDGQMLTGGTGGIGGNLDDGDGLAPSTGDDRGGPLTGISILLFDALEQPITHTRTDENGEYFFGGLPFGTYKIVVEITGFEQAERWVTLSEDHPVSLDNDFVADENGVVNGMAELLTGENLNVFPNPAQNQVNIYLEPAQPFDAQLRLSTLQGKEIWVKNQSIGAGAQRIELNVSDLPTGVYFLQVATGRDVVTKKIVKE